MSPGPEMGVPSESLQGILLSSNAAMLRGVEGWVRFLSVFFGEDESWPPGFQGGWWLVRHHRILQGMPGRSSAFVQPANAAMLRGVEGWVRFLSVFFGEDESWSPGFRGGGGWCAIIGASRGFLGGALLSSSPPMPPCCKPHAGFLMSWVFSKGVGLPDAVLQPT